MIRGCKMCRMTFDCHEPTCNGERGDWCTYCIDRVRRYWKPKDLL